MRGAKLRRGEERDVWGWYTSCRVIRILLSAYRPPSPSQHSQDAHSAQQAHRETTHTRPCRLGTLKETLRARHAIHELKVQRQQ